ncbi:MAG: LCP family protein [Ktedonobacteraceae bacterium]
MSNHSPFDEPTLPAGQLPYYKQQQAYNGQPLPARKPYQFAGPNAQQPTQPVQPQPYIPNTQPNYPLHQGKRGKSQRQPRKRRSGCAIGCLGTVLLLTILGIFLFTTAQKALAFGSAISNQSPLSSQTGYMGGNSRVNILILGYGGSGHDGAYLTDSMVIMSLIPSTHHTTLISVPRDLWIQNPANSGNYTKINDVYPVAAGATNTNPIAGGNAAAQKISLITGLTINYWITINFAGFKDFIDAIGGVDVNVPDEFTAKYPANDDPSINPNWIIVKFTPGVQHMDGAQAIIFARARYVLDNPAEGSDFARSQRQQLIMKAALSKLKDWHTWPNLFNAMDKLKQTLYSNLSLADLAEFAQKMDLNGAHHVGLTNDNVLVDATSDDGQDILLPKNGDWSLLPTYIQQQIYN